MNLDFTLEKFSELCKTVKENYRTITVAEYLSSKNLSEKSEKFVIMRHDVDRKPKNSLNTAMIEHKLGIKATYYFRANDDVFRPEIIQEIENMGHEVGYHYESLGKAKGNYQEAIESFECELNKFRKICNVITICMHGDPLSKYDNRDLWKSYDFRNFGILGEAYLSTGKDIDYFSDTGRSWNSKNNMRDFLHDKNYHKTVDTTDDMIRLIRVDEISKLYILTHPERWSSDNIEWSFNYAKDFVFNTGKKVLMIMRKHKGGL